jgi:hypothetical protein
MTEGVTYKFNIFDFEFFTTMCKHARLNVKNGV